MDGFKLGATATESVFSVFAGVCECRMYALVAWKRHFPQHLYPLLHLKQLMIDCFARHKCILPETSKTWYDPALMPPVSLYVGGKDKLVNGRKLIERFKSVEKEVVLVRAQVDDDYYHLDCLWSMDCIERVGENVREDIWFTVLGGNDVVTPQGCQEEDKGKLVKERDTNGAST